MPVTYRGVFLPRTRFDDRTFRLVRGLRDRLFAGSVFQDEQIVVVDVSHPRRPHSNSVRAGQAASWAVAVTSTTFHPAFSRYRRQMSLPGHAMPLALRRPECDPSTSDFAEASPDRSARFTWARSVREAFVSAPCPRVRSTRPCVALFKELVRQWCAGLEAGRTRDGERKGPGWSTSRSCRMIPRNWPVSR